MLFCNYKNYLLYSIKDGLLDKSKKTLLDHISTFIYNKPHRNMCYTKYTPDIEIFSDLYINYKKMNKDFNKNKNKYKNNNPKSYKNATYILEDILYNNGQESLINNPHNVIAFNDISEIIPSNLNVNTNIFSSHGYILNTDSNNSNSNNSNIGNDRWNNNDDIDSDADVEIASYELRGLLSLTRMVEKSLEISFQNKKNQNQNITNLNLKL